MTWKVATMSKTLILVPVTVIFQGLILAPVAMEKGSVLSQKVDEITQSKVPQTFCNFPL